MADGTGRQPRMVSIVAPAYNEVENLEVLCQRVREVMESLNLPYELIIVENGSHDDSLALLKRLREEDDRIHYLSLSRNFGHQGALCAGLAHARGDVVVSMDADLQHPPEVLPELIDRWRDGYDVVYTIKRERVGLSIFRRAFNYVFYGVLSRLSGLELSGGQSDFRLMDRIAVDALNQLPERRKFLRGLARWIGFRQVGIEYTVPPRFAGVSKFRLSHLFGFALDGILSFSVIPLRVFTLFGILISTSAFLYEAFILISGIYAYFIDSYDHIPPGWTEVAAAIFFFGGIQLLGIGLLGEYIGRIYDEAKQRPTFLVREHSLNEAASDVERQGRD